METQDLRHLLKTETLPEYPQAKIIDVWESILKEYEQLTNNFAYSQLLRKVNWDTSKINRLNGLMACYYLLEMRPEIALEDLRYWKIGIKDSTPESLNKLRTIINQERTRLNIDTIRKYVPSNERVEFEKLIVYAENSLERNLDIEKITVKKWVFLLRSIEEKAEAIKKITNGREYTTGK